MADDKQAYNFDEYIRHGEASQKEKAENWQIAIGLQAVDGLNPSKYLIDNAQKHIKGDITIDDVKENLRSYYVSKVSRTKEEKDEEEADKVSANITKLLASPTFAFTAAGFIAIHQHLFEGVYKFAGKIRDYDITKKEWVLDGDSVLYVNFQDVRRAIEYDLEQERQFSYIGLSTDKVIERLAKFTAGLWQIHPFGEGNTRATAVFIIKYLRWMGYSVDNTLFAQHSWYFRNALVRANYQNTVKKVARTPDFLVKFLRNLMLGENNELKNRYCHSNWAENSVAKEEKENSQTEQVPNKYRTSTEQVPNKLSPSTEQIEQLIMAIGNEELKIQDILNRLQLKHRPHLLENYLNPAISEGFVRMLHPDSPRHPRQRYLLTIKGLAFYNK